MKDRITIGLDGRALQGVRTGVGRYVAELCERLDKILPQATFIIYTHIPITMPKVSDRWSVRVDRFFLSKRLKAIMWLKWRCGAMARKDDLDVFWGTATLLPRLPRRVKTYITVYDMNFLMVPEAMVGTHRLAHQLFYRSDVLRADQVTTISRGTADRLYKQYARTTDAVIHPAVSESFHPADPETCRAVLRRLKITGPYLLAVATWEPRKNLGLLIQAFLELKESGRLPDCRLVLAGGKGWKDEKLRRILDGAHGSDVLPLGFVAEADLAPLYTSADAFVFPSLYEGFGMPPLEAKACGTRVVCSDVPEIREAAGAGAVFIPPTLEGIKAGILETLTRPRPVGRPTDMPTWEAGAARMRDVILDLLREHPAG